MSSHKEKIFYGIGIGPGDPELITVRGLNILKIAPVIFAPRAASKSESLARSIINYYDLGEKEWVEFEFPMTRDEEELKKRYHNAALLVKEQFKKYSIAAYLTLGDPMLYSTYLYLVAAIRKAAPEVETRTVPGIMAAGALAARLDFPLAEKNQGFSIVPVPKDVSKLRAELEKHDTVALYKVASRLPEVIKLLKEMNLLESTVFGSRIGQDGEEILDGRQVSLESLAELDSKGYLSTILVKRNGR